jgi:mono/diheme cytochrome c family protein
MRRIGWLGLFAASALAALALRKSGNREEHRSRPGLAVALAGAAAVTVVCSLYLTQWIAVDPEGERVARYVRAYGCAGCHTIPGMREAVGQVGPVLANLRERTYVGTLRNDRAALAAFIVDPKSVDPATAMPRTGIPPDEAEAVARYLLGLE